MTVVVKHRGVLWSNVSQYGGESHDESAESHVWRRRDSDAKRAVGDFCDSATKRATNVPRVVLGSLELV